MFIVTSSRINFLLDCSASFLAIRNRAKKLENISPINSV